MKILKKILSKGKGIMKQIGIREIQRYETQILAEIDRICKLYEIPYYLNCGSVLGAIRHGGAIPWDTDMDIVVPYPYLDKFYDVMKTNLSPKYRFHIFDYDKEYDRFMPRIGLARNDTLVLHVDVFTLVGLPSDKKQQIRFSKLSTFYNKVFIRKCRPISKMQPSPIMRFLAILIKIVLLPFSRNTLWRIFKKHCGKYPYEQAEYVMNPSGGYGVKNILKKEVFGEPLYVDYDGIKAPIPQQYEYYLKHYYGDYMKYPSKKERDKGLATTIQIDDSLVNNI
jgi:lipopolysaccharide cholinephosphotransferase